MIVPPSAQLFFEQMFSTISYDPIPIEDQIIDVFNLDVSEFTEMNEGNFAQLGYEGAYILTNMGSLLLIMLLSFAYPIVLALLKKCNKTRKWADEKLKTIFCNGILAFFEGTLLIFLVMSSINIKKARKDEAPSTLSLTTVIVILISCLLYFMAITGILCQKPEKLD